MSEGEIFRDDLYLFVLSNSPNSKCPAELLISALSLSERA